MLTSAYKVGGVKKGLKHAYVIFEWSPTKEYLSIKSMMRIENDYI